MSENKDMPQKGTTLKQETHDTLEQKLRNQEEQDSTPSEEGAISYRPVFRPPMAILTVVHDGCKTGEKHVLRADTFRLGRTDGDVVIPHDSQISGLHCEISRRFQEGQWCWFLKDLGSRNGTFVMIKDAQLKYSNQLLIGCHRYRFDAAGPGALESTTQPEGEEVVKDGTQGWQIPKDTDLDKLMPALVRLSPEGDGERFVLAHNEQIIGSDPNQCKVVFTDDRMVSPVHARIWQDASKRWFIEDMDSLNKTWMSVGEKLLDIDMQFQIGEQRVMVKFP